ncbi:MAG TPA: alpha/beta hydrolase-fold protein [Kofleriaceae bacterium]
MTRIASSLLVTLLVACGSSGSPMSSDDTPSGDDGGSGSDPGDGSCPAGYAGAECVIALYDQTVASCDPVAVTTLRAELDARSKLGPLWANGRALFRTDASVAIAGEFNGWSTTALHSTALCNSDLVLAVGAVATGFWPYKLEANDQWSLDAHNPAFAYDDFAGNPDGKNSVINTPDSGRGTVVRLDDACSSALGNCRQVTAYLPPGYTGSSATYPVLFMHDGQNLWDDHDCCFGHTGWEMNVLLDAKIAAHAVAPIIVIGAASSQNRNNEYGLDEALLAKFLAFQTGELQPHALTQVRWNGGKLGIAGSSLGGLVSMHLVMQHADLYDRAASLSGAFWPGMDTHTAVRDLVPGWGKQPVGIYLDHGGDVAQNSDGAADSVEVRDELVGLGWQLSASPDCTMGASSLCYFADEGATHDELAWKARAWRFVEFLYPAP